MAIGCSVGCMKEFFGCITYEGKKKSGEMWSHCDIPFLSFFFFFCAILKGIMFLHSLSDISLLA